MTVYSALYWMGPGPVDKKLNPQVRRGIPALRHLLHKPVHDIPYEPYALCPKDVARTWQTYGRPALPPALPPMVNRPPTGVWCAPREAALCAHAIGRPLPRTHTASHPPNRSLGSSTQTSTRALCWPKPGTSLVPFFPFGAWLGWLSAESLLLLSTTKPAQRRSAPKA